MQTTQDFIGRNAALCDNIQLHAITTIQPHGAVLMICKTRLEVIRVSANIELALERPPREILNTTLCDVFDTESYEALFRAMPETNFQKNTFYKVRFANHFGGKCYMALIYDKQDHLRIEVEFINEIKAEVMNEGTEVGGSIRHFKAMLKECKNIQQTTATVVDSVGSMFGYDKVMIYKFDEQWNGEVIAEHTNPCMDRYLGLRFPATDIPHPVREMYLNTPLRIITSRDYIPVQFVPEAEASSSGVYEITDSRLRGVMPVHLEYLRNMNVVASMSTAIIYNGNLWGLISCHHRCAKSLTYLQVEAIELMSEIISAKISSQIVVEHKKQEAYYEGLYETLRTAVDNRNNITEFFESDPELIQKVLQCDGIAVCFNKEVFRHGSTPPTSEIFKLADWISNQPSDHVIQIDSLHKHFDEAAEYATDASGMMAIPIQYSSGNFLLAFREELIRKVNWGGNPGEVVAHDPQALNYHPRNSFAVYEEIVRFTAKPWSTYEVRLADRVRHKLVQKTLLHFTEKLEDLVSQRTEQLHEQSNRLRSVHEELIELTFVTTHDVQEAVRKIQIAAHQLSVLRTSKSEKSLKLLTESSNRIQFLIHELESFSRIDEEHSSEEIDLHMVLKEILERFSGDIESGCIRVNIGNLPVLTGVRKQISEVFTHLISNSIKFCAGVNDPAISIWEDDSDRHRQTDFHTIIVEDNGVGFDESYAEHMFKLFRKLHPVEDYAGEGVGLAVVKKLVERHGGTIQAFSPKGRGARLVITLPRTRENAGNGV